MILDVFTESGVEDIKAKLEFVKASYAIRDYSSFETKQLSNHDNATWKSAEFICVEQEIDDKQEKALLKRWKDLDWKNQYLIFKSRGIYRLYDSSAQCLCVDEDEIEAFLVKKVNEAISFERSLMGRLVKMKTKSLPVNVSYGAGSLDFDDALMMRLMAGLRTKPFAILAGHSGTGKSRLVRKLAYMTCCDENLRKGNSPGNFLMVPVKPNWHDSTELLGYRSALDHDAYKTTPFVEFVCDAHAYPHVPFFVCLDEMNLAPVEQYFAEYLSVIESAKGEGDDYATDPLVAIDPKDFLSLFHDTTPNTKAREAVEECKKGLPLPKNLFIVGTVNMDDTTCSFSRKVLDRAMTIEMNDVVFESFGSASPKLDYDLLLKEDVIKTLLGGSVAFEKKDDEDKLLDAIKTKLNDVKKALDGTPFQVAYRFANEFALYARALKAFGVAGEDEAIVAKAFDAMVMMKVLPRVTGAQDVVHKVFEKLKAIDGLADGKSLTRKKIDEIEGRKEPYPSFWP